MTPPARPGPSISRRGFDDTRRAESLLADPALAPLAEVRGDLVAALTRAADPDSALLGLVRVVEAAGDEVEALLAALRDDAAARARIIGAMGVSTALVDHLVAHPEQWRDAVDAREMTPEERTEALLAEIADPGDLEPQDALRVGYRRQLLGIAARDTTAEDPVEFLPQVGRALADLAGSALEGAVRIAIDELGDEGQTCRFAVIGMGKAGGRELNYVSDVDVIFVAEPVEGADEAAALDVATRVATRMMHACSDATAHGSLWPVDPALRPEGKQGPLVRTVASHRAYYERWAKTWEFQALLKARHLAGDATLGAEYLAAVQPMVWEAASREDFVDDVQAMRRRVEEHIPAAEASRQLKLGPGGLRDVEFSVQLLQLVHGRTDESLHSGTTLDALAALSAGGYVGRADTAVLADAYKVLRTLEHRIQLHRLRRTHLMPTAEADLRRLGRALHLWDQPDKQVVQLRTEHSREVRRLHQRLFYRPLLSAVAKLSPDEARLTPDAARARLSALGYRDPAGALRHLEVLTDGVNRTAAIQRQLLPVMLEWFAEMADPDAGLLAFLKVSEELGTTHWYLRLLRDEGEAAQILAHTLGASRFAGDLLLASPEAVQMLGDPDGLRPREREEILKRMRAAASRRDEADAAVASIRAIRRAEIFRVAVADLQGRINLEQVGDALTDISEAVIQASLEVVVRAVEADRGAPVGTDLLIVGMGRLGGSEMGYSSDADVLYVHEPHEGTDDQAAQEAALAVVGELRRLLGAPGSDPPLGLDADLRPEGKSGPMVRSLASYATYYERWSETWEAQALLRARPVAGDPGLGERFTALIDPIRWPAEGLDATQVREVRRLKARMEAERLPRGADRKAHFKLGMGGLSDVEWTVQLLQLQHAHDHEELRTTRTLPALGAAVEVGLVGGEDAVVLREAWSMASLLRNAGMLFRGRPVDSVPSNLREADGVGRIVGMAPQSGLALAESYRRTARHARQVVDRIFYGGV
ncbi:bifunctional [glutamine synthetase] adenylyltransferase/[glutamine synthetase]-adenylyl-L-tyrosine phosphorylase [Janibacter indicus]|uniref:Bifunctional glutamine synthetase adenylyltransferase/adenylyl-removing enzyme n=1 Tax=Janibacter indicus TaxID=857417 RepID=A0A1W2B2Z9_9MICO|nr:bifunctional [glutamine synthetase] adenylyltransferase/[glutamine synthetase]-adenylyl-L-tyrosine phosphorylase [Janibacter indicus]SMC67082.1 glutamate-ammonia-ligase adenylyltransferase [Janibacter indicus]